jgi:hypothetical protein
MEGIELMNNNRSLTKANFETTYIYPKVGRSHRHSAENFLFHDMAPPLRVAIIGLSASAKSSWAAEGHLSYLSSDLGRQSYTVTALCNSSVAAAEKAIAHFGLPSSTKAYGSPRDLAADPDIDLVVVSKNSPIS